MFTSGIHDAQFFGLVSVMHNINFMFGFIIHYANIVSMIDNICVRYPLNIIFMSDIQARQFF